jgi:uncharacterized phage infection (PIP) family protein YhgE
LKRCIQSIKAELTQQIKSQVAELKSKLSGISDLTEFPKVFEKITGLGEVFKGIRDRASVFTDKAKELQDTTKNFFNNVSNYRPSVSLRSPFRAPFGRE